MPAFQQPGVASGKRKAEDSSYTSNKRLNTEHAVSDFDEEQYWIVQWRAPQTKKHKTWDGDGVLLFRGMRGTLYDMQKKQFGSGKITVSPSPGLECHLADKDIQFDRIVTREEYISGVCFGIHVVSESRNLGHIQPPALTKPFLAVQPRLIKPTNKSHLTTSTTRLADNAEGTIGSEKESDQPIAIQGSYWTANWRKHQTKKNKTWDGDAVIQYQDSKLTMYSEDGKIMAMTSYLGNFLHSGFRTTISGKEIELDCQIQPTQLPWLTRTAPVFEDMSVLTSEPTPYKPVHKTVVQPAAFYGRSAPLSKKRTGPLHDPEAEGAVIMKVPTKEHMRKYNQSNFPVVPVVLDPILSRHMRPHQKEGVKFMYECIFGLRKYEGQGCILADEMGLGKTLQTIALIWTLLKQSPYEGMKPPLNKALIVCPVSLVKNWSMEFTKWLGRDRIGVVTWDDSNAIKTYQNNKHYQVLIIGYERLKTVIDDLKSCVPPIGLIVCDEGHRLKSANNKTSSVFRQLKTPRRVILSGTPIQNDLSEFHAMADFCNPELLDDYATFRKVYEMPIIRSRAPGCTAQEEKLGKERMAQLLAISNCFVLRRDASILKNYLPPKTEYVVLVKPTNVQISMFQSLLSKNLDEVMNGSASESLALINLLTKISNNPVLLKKAAEKSKAGETAFFSRLGLDDEAVNQIGDEGVDCFLLSGKLLALSRLLSGIHQRTEEKVVVVSHYVSTLDIIEAFCQRKKYPYFRLDGQTPATKRQEFVNHFNKGSRKNSFIFLLSSKAGGVGINLIGASRLCLIDQDWNPSHDLQSMARIHRDGQKHPVFIYRFLTTGTIDEKIFQRQVTKLGLSGSLIEPGKSGSKTDSFSYQDLRDIFRIHLTTACHTHDLLECNCEHGAGGGGLLSVSNVLAEDALSDSDSDSLENGFIIASQMKQPLDDAAPPKKKPNLAALGEWRHFNCLWPVHDLDDIHDELLRSLIACDRETPQIKLHSLDSGVDPTLDGLTHSLRLLPAGGITFLFEKASEVSQSSDQ